jgi:hypothetical protein
LAPSFVALVRRQITLESKNQLHVRPILGLLAGFSALYLIAAAPPTQPTLRTKPALATPAPFHARKLTLPSIDPVVLVYPFDSVGGLNPKAGKQLADLFRQQIHASGHVNVLPVPTNVVRTAYRTTAIADHADYYISGYATPIGDTLSVVMQVVNTQSGVIVFSQTSQLYGVNDARSLAITAHDAILQLAGVNVDVNTAQAQATAAPSAQPTNGASFNISNLFGHHGKSAQHVTSTSTSQVKPSRGVILVSVQGAGVPSGDLNEATFLLYHDLSAHFDVRNDGPAPGNLSTSATTLCGTDRNNTVATGTLVQEHIGGFRPRTKSHFTLQIWTCFGDVLYQTTKTDFDVAKAISESVSDYVTTHPANS